MHPAILQLGVGDVRVDLHPRHVAAIGYRHGIAIAQALRCHADQHPAAGEESLRHLAAQHADIGNGRKAFGWSKAQPPCRIAIGGLSAQCHQVRQRCAIFRGGKAQRRSAHGAVGVDLRVRMADGSGPPGKCVHRIDPLERLAVATGDEELHRETHAEALHGFGQRRVIGGRLGQQQVHRYRLRTRIGELLEQFRMQAAWPRPAAQRGQALLVDRDDQDIRIGFGRGSAHRGIVEQIVGGARPATEQSGDHEHRRERRDPDPLDMEATAQSCRSASCALPRLIHQGRSSPSRSSRYRSRLRCASSCRPARGNGLATGRSR